MFHLHRKTPAVIALSLIFPLTILKDADPTLAGHFENHAETSQNNIDDPKPSTTQAEKDHTIPTEKNSGPVSPKYPSFSKLLDGAQAIPGMIRLHRKNNKLYGELTANHFDQDYIVLISIAKGIGHKGLLGGMSWSDGDDWIWQFHLTEERILLVRRNVRFTATPGSPEEHAVKLAYTDSVLYSLPIATKSPAGAYVVDLTPVFMGDLPQISQVLPGFTFSSPKSTWAAVKSFKNNVELEVSATYSSSGTSNIESVADSRGVTLHVHYSISKLPQTGYQTRLADDRVGYFVTVLKDYSNQGPDDRFVRYINRWQLEKADPQAEMSPPEKPIIFWMEKTIPIKYRKPIRDGILAWNKAFESVGFYDAIQVRQQGEHDTWDPEDIRYNTFRWITSSSHMAMGPSRVDPTTGQILDADIIFDADFLQYWKQEYEAVTPHAEVLDFFARQACNPQAMDSHDFLTPLCHRRNAANSSCRLSPGLTHQFAFATSVMAVRTQKQEDQEKMIQQGLQTVAMHEVGHTLGLRHNFKASATHSLADINDQGKTSHTSMTSSVMDYMPANLVPTTMPQGNFFSTTIGPYDVWAIEYGYRPLLGGSQGEQGALKKIASRSGEPALAYATDEDARQHHGHHVDPDPQTNRFDLGDDILAFARQRAEMVRKAWPDIVIRMTEEGEGYQRAQRGLRILLAEHSRAMHLASRYIGGISSSRSHKGDPGAQDPFEVISAEKQRETLTLLEKEVFSDQPFRFPPDLLNHLSSSRWQHWGTQLSPRSDFPIHQLVLTWQERILNQLLYPTTLERLHDSEIKVPADQDAFSTVELMDRLTKTIFSEINTIEQGEFTHRRPAISSLRRNLQRTYLKKLSQLAMGNRSAPQDCQTVAYVELTRLAQDISDLLEQDLELDRYSRAHLEESAIRIHKVINAGLELKDP